MRKATFMVKVKRKGREKDYDAFWSGTTKSESGETLNSDVVGFVVEVRANNKRDAVQAVRAMHPGLQVDVDATQRLG